MAVSPPGPLLTLATVVALLGGLWYTDPAHKEVVRDELVEIKGRIHELERDLSRGFKAGKERLAARKAKVAAKMRALLHRFDRNGDGTLESADLDVDGDGKVTSSDLHVLVDGVVDEEPERSWFLSPKWLSLFALIDIAVVALAWFAVNLWRKDKLAHVNTKGMLKLEIVKANNLVNVDSGKKEDVSDPFAVASVPTAGKVSTSCVKNNLNPVWKKTGSIEVDSSKPKQNTLLIELWDGKDSMFDLGKSKSLGHADIDISAMFRTRPNEEVTRTLSLHGGFEGHAQGTVTIAGTFVPHKLPKDKTVKSA